MADQGAGAREETVNDSGSGGGGGSGGGSVSGSGGGASGARQNALPPPQRGGGGGGGDRLGGGARLAPLPLPQRPDGALARLRARLASAPAPATPLLLTDAGSFVCPILGCEGSGALNFGCSEGHQCCLPCAARYVKSKLLRTLTGLACPSCTLPTRPLEERLIAQASMCELVGWTRSAHSFPDMRSELIISDDALQFYLSPLEGGGAFGAAAAAGGAGAVEDEHAGGHGSYDALEPLPPLQLPRGDTLARVAASFSDPSTVPAARLALPPFASLPPEYQRLADPQSAAFEHLPGIPVGRCQALAATAHARFPPPDFHLARHWLAYAARRAKPCPNCGEGSGRSRGHACHHIYGCSSCTFRYCYSCLGPLDATNQCDKECGLFCDAFCQCEDCEECKEGAPCTSSSGIANCDNDGRCRTCQPGRHGIPLEEFMEGEEDHDGEEGVEEQDLLGMDYVQERLERLPALPLAEVAQYLLTPPAHEFESTDALTHLTLGVLRHLAALTEERGDVGSDGAGVLPCIATFLAVFGSMEDPPLPPLGGAGPTWEGSQAQVLELVCSVLYGASAGSQTGAVNVASLCAHQLISILLHSRGSPRLCFNASRALLNLAHLPSVSNACAERRVLDFFATSGWTDHPDILDESGEAVGEFVPLSESDGGGDATPLQPATPPSRPPLHGLGEALCRALQEQVAQPVPEEACEALLGRMLTPSGRLDGRISEEGCRCLLLQLQTALSSPPPPDQPPLPASAEPSPVLDLAPRILSVLSSVLAAPGSTVAACLYALRALDFCLDAWPLLQAAQPAMSLPHFFQHKLRPDLVAMLRHHPPRANLELAVEGCAALERTLGGGGAAWSEDLQDVVDAALRTLRAFAGAAAAGDEHALQASCMAIKLLRRVLPPSFPPPLLERLKPALRVMLRHLVPPPGLTAEAHASGVPRRLGWECAQALGQVLSDSATAARVRNTVPGALQAVVGCLVEHQRSQRRTGDHPHPSPLWASLANLVQGASTAAVLGSVPDAEQARAAEQLRGLYLAELGAYNATRLKEAPQHYAALVSGVAVLCPHGVFSAPASAEAVASFLRHSLAHALTGGERPPCMALHACKGLQLLLETEEESTRLALAREQVPQQVMQTACDGLAQVEGLQRQQPAASAAPPPLPRFVPPLQPSVSPGELAALRCALLAVLNSALRSLPLHPGGFFVHFKSSESGMGQARRLAKSVCGALLAVLERERAAAASSRARAGHTAAEMEAELPLALQALAHLVPQLPVLLSQDPPDDAFARERRGLVDHLLGLMRCGTAGHLGPACVLHSCRTLLASGLLSELEPALQSEEESSRAWAIATVGSVVGLVEHYATTAAPAYNPEVLAELCSAVHCAMRSACAAASSSVPDLPSTLSAMQGAFNALHSRALQQQWPEHGPAFSFLCMALTLLLRASPGSRQAALRALCSGDRVNHSIIKLAIELPSPHLLCREGGAGEDPASSWGARCAALELLEELYAPLASGAAPAAGDAGGAHLLVAYGVLPLLISTLDLATLEPQPPVGTSVRSAARLIAHLCASFPPYASVYVQMGSNPVLRLVMARTKLSFNTPALGRGSRGACVLALQALGFDKEGKEASLEDIAAAEAAEAARLQAAAAADAAARAAEERAAAERAAAAQEQRERAARAAALPSPSPFEGMALPQLQEALLKAPVSPTTPPSIAVELTRRCFQALAALEGPEERAALIPILLPYLLYSLTDFCPPKPAAAASPSASASKGGSGAASAGSAALGGRVSAAEMQALLEASFSLIEQGGAGAEALMGEWEALLKALRGVIDACGKAQEGAPQRSLAVCLRATQLLVSLARHPACKAFLAAETEAFAAGKGAGTDPTLLVLGRTRAWGIAAKNEEMIALCELLMRGMGCVLVPCFGGGYGCMAATRPTHTFHHSHSFIQKPRYAKPFTRPTAGGSAAGRTGGAAGGGKGGK